VSRPYEDHGLRPMLRVLLLGHGLADLEADALELTYDLRDLTLREVVLDRECLELCRLDPSALLTRLDQRAGTFGFQQFGKLTLGQVEIDVLSFLRTAGQPC